MQFNKNSTGRRLVLSGLLLVATLLGCPAMLIAQTLDCDAAPSEVLESLVDPNGWNATIAMEQCGRFIIGWQEILPDPNYPTQNRQDIFVARFETSGDPLGATAVVSD